MNNLFVRTVSGLVLILIVLGSILFTEYSLLGLTLFIFSISLYEFKNMFGLKGKLLFYFSQLIAYIILVLAFLYFSNNLQAWLIAPIAIAVITITVFYYFFGKRSLISDISKMLFGVFWLAGSLTFFIGIGFIDDPNSYDPSFLVLLLIFIWVNDIGAYLVGSFLGKRPLAPSVSPGKTWEGFLSGIAINIFAGLLIFIILEEKSALFWISLAVIVSLGATIGDLFESKLKREAGVKDSGKLIPGHGGMLDRFDSLIFTAPIYYLILLIW